MPVFSTLSIGCSSGTAGFYFLKSMCSLISALVLTLHMHAIFIFRPIKENVVPNEIVRVFRLITPYSCSHSLRMEEGSLMCSPQCSRQICDASPHLSASPSASKATFPGISLSKCLRPLQPSRASHIPARRARHVHTLSFSSSADAAILIKHQHTHVQVKPLKSKSRLNPVVRSKKTKYPRF